MSFVHSYSVRIQKDIWEDILRVKDLNKTTSINSFINDSLKIGIRNKFEEYSKRKITRESINKISNEFL